MERGNKRYINLVPVILEKKENGKRKQKAKKGKQAQVVFVLPLKTKTNCVKAKFLTVLICSSGQLTIVTNLLSKRN